MDLFLASGEGKETLCLAPYEELTSITGPFPSSPEYWNIQFPKRCVSELFGIMDDVQGP
jgi:hypothetical protein